MWKLAAVSFSYIILIGCYPENPETNQDLVKNPKNKETSLKANTNTSPEVSYNTEKQTTSAVINQVIESMQQQFAHLSQTQMQFIKEAALKEANQIAKDTATQIASNAANQAIENMQQQFTNLSQSQKQAIKEATLELVNQIAEDTATQIASNAASEAIENMQQQFVSLSQLQTQVIKEATLKLANQIAKDTATQIASNATSEAIENMEQQFENLSQSQKQAIKEATLKLANQIAKDTATQIASSVTNQAIKNMDQKFAHLSQAQMQIIRENALEAAKDTATQIASNAASEAIENMEQQFTNLSQSQKQAIKEATLKLANQIAEDTATQVASNAASEAIENMEQQFANLSQSQKQAIKEATLKLANQIAEDTATQVASNAASQAIENMDQKFENLSQSQIQAIKEASLEAATAIAREAADKVIEDTVERVTLAATNHAIQGMEQQFSDLLKEGLRTIISAAIEAAIAASTHESIDDATKQDVVNQVKILAVEAAEGITLGNTNQISNYENRQSFNLPFEECHWTNQNYTVRLVKDHSFFPLSDPLKDMLERWDNFQPKNERAGEEAAGCDSSSERDQDLLDEQNGSCVSKERDTQSDMEGEFAYLSPLYDEFILSFLKDTIKDTYLSEDDVPLECFFASSVRGANMYDPGENFYYCDKDSSRPGNMTVTDDNEKTREIPPHRACLNKDYIYLTARAFNKTAECFGFDKSEKENIFKLLNHESAFLHNIKSPTGAKCYGQLTTVNITEINKQIYFSDTASPFPYSYIFNEVIEKCPGLQNAVLNPKIYGPIAKGNKSMETFNELISQVPISCKLTQNPYSCLFYAFYNIKKNSADIDIQFKKDTTFFNKTYSVPQEFKDRFLLPISLNSMVGVTNTGGRDMIFWDDSEIWSDLRNYSPESLHNIRKLPLFENEKEVKDLFNLWTYNGGISISKKYMTKFIRQLKLSIASPCPLDSKTKICQYRFAVADGEGLKTADIKRDFQIYLQEHYQVTNSDDPDTNDDDDSVTNDDDPDTNDDDEKRRKEVTFFATNVTKSLNYLYNKKGLFKSHLKNLVPELESQEIDSFQDHLQNVCPKP